MQNKEMNKMDNAERWIKTQIIQNRPIHRSGHLSFVYFAENMKF